MRRLKSDFGKLLHAQEFTEYSGNSNNFTVVIHHILLTTFNDNNNDCV